MTDKMFFSMYRMRNIHIWILAFSILSILNSSLSDDGQVLSDLRKHLEDPLGALHNWGNSTHFCNWSGISCSPELSVARLNFTNFQLNGTLSAQICELTSLTSLIIPYNNFQQSIQGLFTNCTSLSHLDLSENFFYGPLPEDLPPVNYLDLSANNFDGSIPLGLLRSSLEVLVLTNNFLTSFPSEISELTNLTYLNLSYNPFTPSTIPKQFGNLTKLVELSLSGCRLVGSIPLELGNMKELDFLELQYNNLTGSIPAELMNATKLTKLELYANKLTGDIPREIGNLALVTDIDASQNFLSGSIPEEISTLKNLRVFQLYSNQLTGEIPQGLAGLKYIEYFLLYSNRLTGKVPYLMGVNSSSLKQFTVSQNMLTGELPPYICNGGQLQNLSFYDNNFTGRIPESYGDCRSFMRFQVHNNSLEGPVPEKLWSSPKMIVLNLSFNRFNGTVSSAVGSALNLSILYLNNNQFSGRLPQEVWDIPKLDTITASDNAFTGPVTFGECPSLANLDISNNQLSGEISKDISNCRKLTTLDLSYNKLSGEIPSTMGSLPTLNAVDLSNNRLTGEIPASLGGLRLSSLNISYNDLHGRVPDVWTVSFDSTSFEGNAHLCNGQCPTASNRGKSHGLPMAGLVIIVLVAVVLAVALGYKLLTWRLRREIDKQQWEVKSFQRLSFDELDVVDKLHNSNVIGSGGSGKVYRVDLFSGQSLAVKQLWRSEIAHCQHQFEAEIRTLGEIRHRNIVRLLSCCTNYNTDLLILEYVPNGSLGDVLHGKRVVNLDWKTRYKIAVGAAEGLSYLHHDCIPAVLHRDIKSNNILLDENFEAKLADFGIAKLLESGNYHSMTDVAGSYGYIAPEYAYTLKVNEKSDTYSFGVVLLELVTGKRPIEAEYGECVDIVKWVRSRVHMKGGPEEVLDQRLRDTAEPEMLMCLEIALLCTSAAPAARPTMRQVVEMLKRIEPDPYLVQQSSPGSTPKTSLKLAARDLQ